uniref:Uncharacterized protein n=1 Tax=viral metagenome TaxID=1070528 RepID=A0A6C0CMC4_9ZZZZ
MDKLARNLIIFGLLLSVIGIVILVLQFTTNAFKKDTLISAGTAITDGMAVAQSAFITWDDTSIVTDASNNIVKWASTTQFTDSATGSPYTYDLVPCAYSTEFTPVAATANGTSLVYSNSGLPGVCTTATTYLGRVPNATQTWASYPELSTPHSVYIVGKTATGVSTGGFLYMSTDYKSLAYTLILAQLQCSTTDAFKVDMSNYSTTDPIPAVAGGPGVLKYASSSGTQVASCIFGYEYEGGVSGGIGAASTLSTITGNGQLTTRLYQVSSTGSAEFTSLNTTRGVKLRFGQPYVSINRLAGGGIASTIYCVLVFKSILTEVQRTSLFAYLNSKYFKQAMVYPKTLTGTVGNALTVPIVNGASRVGDPVRYTILPTLPAGMSFTAGSISGTPISFMPPIDYRITATNSVIANTSVINIAINSAQTAGGGGTTGGGGSTGGGTTGGGSTNQNKTTSSPPNIVYTVPQLKLNQVVSLQPSNVGDKVDKYTINPANITQLTGLTFDSTTGILSGTVTTSANISITITATNDSGDADTQFALRTGLIIEYASTSIDSMIDQPIEILRLKLLSNELSSVKSLNYTGDLFGLAFNKTTGDISGTPTRVGMGKVTVTAIFSDGITASTELSIRVSKRVKTSVDPGIIIGAGSVSTAVGVGLISYGTYLELA